MTVRYTETKGELKINIEDFVFDCFDYKLPQLMPKASRTDQIQTALILHELVMKKRNLPDAESTLHAHGIKVSKPLFKKLCTAADNINGAIVGLGMDMIEEGAPERVLWDV